MFRWGSLPTARRAPQLAGYGTIAMMMHDTVHDYTRTLPRTYGHSVHTHARKTSRRSLWVSLELHACVCFSFVDLLCANSFVSRQTLNTALRRCRLAWPTAWADRGAASARGVAARPHSTTPKQQTPSARAWRALCQRRVRSLLARGCSRRCARAAGDQSSARRVSPERPRRPGWCGPSIERSQDESTAHSPCPPRVDTFRLTP